MAAPPVSDLTLFDATFLLSRGRTIRFYRGDTLGEVVGFAMRMMTDMVESYRALVYMDMATNTLLAEVTNRKSQTVLATVRLSFDEATTAPPELLVTYNT